MASLIGYPKFQAFDASGNPLSGGKVYTYLSGTVTPKDTYTSNTEAVVNANPVILDSRGEANIWLSANFAYTFSITDSADVVVATVDNIIGVFNPLSGGFGLGGDLQVKDYSITDNNTVAVPYFDFTTTASAVNYFGVTNAAAGNSPKLSVTGTSLNVGCTLQTKGTGPLSVLGSAGSTTMLTVSNVASAVNAITITNAITGSGASIVSTGSDLNIPVTVSGKGTGPVQLGQATSTDVRLVADQPIADSSGNELIKFVKAASAVNEITITNAATGNGVSVTATGGDGTIAVTLAQKGAAGMVFGAALCTGYTFTAGAITVTSGNIALTSGNLILTSGTITSSGNITASSGGITATAGDLTASSGTLSVSSPVTVSNGGIGVASTTAYAVLCGGTTATGALQSIASVGTAGHALVSNGAAALPSFQAITVAASVYEPQLRLTLTTATPVTVSDVSAATTLYYTPYKGGNIALYDGVSTWTNYLTTQISIAVPAVATQIYDVFVYNSAGTPTLELTAWTNDTTRATALTTQDGIYVKTGATTRRYVGSFRTVASGQTEDSIARRYVWNMYHQVPRTMRVIEATASWTYTTTTFRQARASTANQLDFIIGLNSPVECVLEATWSNSAAGVPATIGIGLDSTTTNSSSVLCGYTTNGGVNYAVNPLCRYNDYPGVGRHILVWLEASVAAGVATWYGTNGLPGSTQSGLIGSVLA